MNNKISVIVKRYLVAVFIILIGLFMVVFGLQSNQDTLFVVAAINLLVGGILFFLFSSGKMSKNLVLGIGSLCIIATIGVGYMSVQSVETTMQHEIDYKKSEARNIYVLNEIRDVQRAYKAKYGVYAPNFNALKDFFLHDTIQKIDAAGAVPSRKLTLVERDALYSDNRAIDNNMTEQEAARLVALGNPGNSADLAGFKRDTIDVTYKEVYLSSTTRSAARKQLGLGAFNFEELKYIPMTDPKEEWVIETRDSVPYLNGDTIATIFVHGKSAIPKYEGGDRQVVSFGNLKTGSDKGNWE